MVLGGPGTDDGSGSSSSSSGSQVISIRVKKTIQSIQEIVRNHSDAEIYAMLKETNMDPNETAQKLLNQDPFHEVKRRRDKKKEHADFKAFADTRKPAEHNVQWVKPPTSWDQNAQRGGYGRNPTPGISRKFRIVRDNRVNQNTHSDAKLETSQLQNSGGQQVLSNIPNKNSTQVLSDKKHLASKNPEGHVVSRGVNEPHDSGPPGAKDLGLSRSHRPFSHEETQTTVSDSTPQLQRVVKHNYQTNATLTSASSVAGVYSSSSDPVHIPSPDSRSAGTVGAIRREVGSVGVRRQSSDRPTTRSSVSSNTASHPSLREDIYSSTESFGHTGSMNKSNQLSQTPASERYMPSMSISRSFLSNQYHSKVHQQIVGHQKAAQPNMEWKPKPSQKSTVISPSVIGMTSALSSSGPDNSNSSGTVDATGLSDKLSQVDVLENQHVIIPQHLRVPESERTQLTFGSFGTGFDSTKGFTSALSATDNVESRPSVSVSSSVPGGSSEDASTADQGDLVDGRATTSRSDSDSPSPTVESDWATTGNNESLSHNIESYAEIGLVQSHCPPYSLAEPHHRQYSPSMPSFSAYDTQTSYDAPFFRTMMEDNVRGQGLASPSEALSSRAANSSSPSSVAMTHQQPVQLYPQVQIPQFPNFVPYRHVFSPVYVPPMPIPNYPSNPSYPHPSNGSNYLLMPGGSSHLTAGGIKYATSQYKPVPAGSLTGYGNYTNPAGFTISAPASIGTGTGLEDVTRFKYKDSNLYVPNPQAESSDIWIQTPREVPGLQSAPYYNLPGQAAHAAFMPAHGGHASFNAAAHSSHVQYPGLYHPPQPTSIPNSHHLVHQQMTPGFGGDVGVGVAAPGPQVGTYQQPQISHLNWPANF